MTLFHNNSGLTSTSFQPNICLHQFNQSISFFPFHYLSQCVRITFSFLSHLPLRSPTNPTRKEDNMPPMEKIATDNDQYMTTAGCCPASGNMSSSVLFPDRPPAFSDHTPRDRPQCFSMTCDTEIFIEHQLVQSPLYTRIKRQRQNMQTHILDIVSIYL